MNLLFTGVSVNFLHILSHLDTKRSFSAKFLISNGSRTEFQMGSYKRCLILFARYPEKGKVKTRMIREGNGELVANLYRCFIEDCLERMSKGNYRFCVACDPPGSENAFAEQFGNNILYKSQRGSDLGARMCNAFAECFAEGLPLVVIVGSDIPDLPKEFIREAFEALEGHDAVIGPSRDGGYYLIGFSKDSLCRSVFENMAWSTENVFKETLWRLRQDGASVHVLPVWRDVDACEDLEALMREYDHPDFGTSKTIRFLKAHGFI